jgi:hypothetical protein
MTEQTLARILRGGSRGKRAPQEASNAPPVEAASSEMSPAPNLLPAWVPSACVCALHMTVAHAPFRRLFLAPWVASGLFHAIASMFPTVAVAC